MTIDMTAIPSAGFDLSSPEFQKDPYSFYRQLRRDTPVARIPGDFVLLSRYEQCRRILSDPAWSMPTGFACTAPTDADAEDDPNIPGMRRTLGVATTNEADADEALARTLMVRTFTKHAARQVKERMAEPANQLIDRALDEGDVDFMSAFCTPFVTGVICDFFGVPASDRSMVTQWAVQLADTFDPLMQCDQEMALQGQAGREFSDYMAKLVSERRRNPGEDFLSALLTAEDKGQRLSDEELLTTSVCLAIAATSPPILFIGLAVWSLLRHPDQLALLVANPDMVPSAIEELLRFASPVQFTMRVAPDDHVVDGYRIRRGENVIALIASANRDETVFADSERLDLTRQGSPHLAFGHGRYYCFGSNFARTEAQVALTALVTRAPKSSLAGEPEMIQRFGNRGPSSLPVTMR